MKYLMLPLMLLAVNTANAGNYYLCKLLPTSLALSHIYYDQGVSVDYAVHDSTYRIARGGMYEEAGIIGGAIRELYRIRALDIPSEEVTKKIMEGEGCK